MHEVAVTLTDYALAVEGCLLAWLLSKIDDGVPEIRRWFIWFLAALAFTAAVGGTVHGFFPDEESMGYAILWRTTLVSLGFLAFTGWGMGAAMALPHKWARIVTAVAAIEFISYAAFVLFVSQAYLVGVINYLPASCFVLAAFVWLWAGRGVKAARWGVVGILLTFVAAGVQTAGVSVHPVYLDHNTLYHLIQAIALVFIYLVGRGLGAQQNPR